ncbi:MAG: zf-HC2 domain-containing protein [Acidobacteria bacterium]|nr:zf-HC2 domain-containing protein [Acidobacteriota bacterium]
MKGEREVGGVRCGEVLAVLSDFVDGTIERGMRSRVEEHLRGCDACERFGGVFAETVRALREGLAAPDALDQAARERLRRLTESA